MWRTKKPKPKVKNNMRFSRALFFGSLMLLLAGCDSISEIGAEEKPEKLEGTRYEVLVGVGQLTANEDVQDFPIDIPSPQKNSHWLNHQDGSEGGNLARKAHAKEFSATIGDGYNFDQGLAASPVVAAGKVFAIDGAGFISAHRVEDVSNTLWVNEDVSEKDTPNMLGGGLTVAGDTLYVGTGYGRIAAINTANGKTKWNVRLGAPVRGAPAASGETVLVITADNQTIALRAADGQPRWEHRGIRENAGFFSTTSPVIAEGLAIIAYSSGEVFALRLETGNPVWGDNVQGTNRTNASAAFAGVNADPVVQDGVVYIVSAAGGMTANALLNGRPLWQQEVAAHATPWAAGNTLYVLTAQHQLAALLKRDGSVRWVQSLGVRDEDNRDITPKLFAPILADGQVMVLDNAGALHRFRADTGKKLGALEVGEDAASSPVIARETLFFVRQNATLQAYR
jgi:outer membrane protein assembly factor BamB